jgi:hypothetical protein
MKNTNNRSNKDKPFTSKLEIRRQQPLDEPLLFVPVSDI